MGDSDASRRIYPNPAVVRASVGERPAEPRRDIREIQA